MDTPTRPGSAEPSGPGPSVSDPAARGDRPAGQPDDASLTRVLAELDAEGWSGQLQSLEGGRIRCLTCRHELDAATVDADAVRRLEGASDPDDMMIVVPVRCPSCETKAVLVASYGPEASVEDADVVAALSRSPGRGEPGRPAHTA